MWLKKVNNKAIKNTDIE